MKRFLAAIAAAALSTAVAQPIGFFHHQDAGPGGSILAARAKALDAATTACAIQIRYDWPDATGGEIAYIGSGCYATAYDAIEAARIASIGAKAEQIVGGEPAKPHTYRCGVIVGWDPPTASSPSITPLGGDLCEPLTHTAIFFASYAIGCTHLPPEIAPPCRP